MRHKFLSRNMSEDRKIWKTRGEKKKRKFSFKERYDRKQKKKLKKELAAQELAELSNEILTQNEQETQTPKVKKPTVSVALPGSILDNAQSPELRTYLAGQIARALVIFNIDEVIIFNENSARKSSDSVFKGATRSTDSNVLFARILQYLECPQYLRKYFFPVHQDLKYAGLLNPLDCPHHMRMDDHVSYREGVTLDRPVKGGGSFVNCGMRKEVKIDKLLKPNVRVTVRLDEYDDGKDTLESKKHVTGKVIPPSTPREEDLYWGYTVRVANNFSAVFTESNYRDGYDLTIGTSERGVSLDEMYLPCFNHLLIVFGGLKGLESSLEADESLKETDIELLFDHYVNSCPQQGSKTIRTEEAVLITLSLLRPKISSVT